MLSPSVSSNFSSSINWDDIRLFGVVMFLKKINPNMKFDFGIGYSATLGKPSPLPIFRVMWTPQSKVDL
ncbi:DUF6268 family outer membrane beta-barrel protein [Labilibaculum sp. K2S]|uniref:DUF6268 family outer membrane beta-barrel protein n=1 Tax=Labilibaculum sp. K2S TaxID=3056386 RepID=UPI003FA5C012